jgi:acyl carrier protein
VYVLTVPPYNLRWRVFGRDNDADQDGSRRANAITLGYLRRKFYEGLRAGRKIYVLEQQRSIPAGQAALFRVDVARDAAHPIPLPAVHQYHAPARYVRPAGLAPSEPNGDLRGAEMTVVARVIRLLLDVFERPELEYQAPAMLRAIPGYDVTRFVRLVLALEAEFGISLHEDEVDSIAAMGEIVGVLAGKVLDTDASAARPARAGRNGRPKADPPKGRANLGEKINPPRKNLAPATRRI